MFKVLVTGGSGFIGTNLITNLLKDNFQVLSVDIALPANHDHLSKWEMLDILNYQELEKTALAFDPHFIVHLAAVTDLNGKTSNYYHTNVEGTQNVIKVAEKLPRLKKIVFASSMYVCKPGDVPADYKTFNPHTLYGESKVEGERLVNEIKDANYKWVIIRPTSIWGPWFKIPYIDFFDVVYKGKFVNFNKICTKTYGYVGNTVFQIRLLMAADDVYSKTFYLGDMQPTPISEWANEISEKLGKGRVKSVPFIIVKAAALFGDALSKLKISFPLTSFRLQNMMTDNIFSLKDLYAITGDGPYTRAEGTTETIKWLVKYRSYRLPAKADISA